MTIRPDRVAIYVRWSTDDQAEGTTLEVQLDGCTHYILSQGWQVNEKLVFVDDGYSGGTLNRPALSRLRHRIDDGAVDCVVVFKLDRLSRSVIDMVNLVLGEWDGRTHVKSAREPLDTATPMGKQFFYMLVSFAEWERNVIRERTHSGKLKRAQEGKNPGFRQPFGYARGDTPGSLRVVEGEAAIVRRIFDLYVSGLGEQQIRHLLNHEGFRTRSGHFWGSATVAYILKNRLYSGDLVYGLRPVNPRHHKPGGGPRQVRCDKPLVVATSAIPALVSRELFAQADAIRRRRAAARPQSRTLSSDHLLTGATRCLKCGGTILGRKGTWVKGHKYNLPYYICGGKRAHGRTACDCGYIRQDALDGWIVEKLLARYSSELGEHKLLDDMGASVAEQLAAAEQRLAALQGELVAVERELGVLTRDYRREKLTVDEYKGLKGQVDGERLRLAAALVSVEEEVRGLKRRQAHAAGLETIVVSGLAQWEPLTTEQKKHILRQLITEMKVYKASKSDGVQYELTWIGRTGESLGAPGGTTR